MDIVIVAQYLCDVEHLDESNSRFVYLAKLLSKEHNVELITTTYLHTSKKHANKIPSEYKCVKITALYEPGYSRNVSLKRFFSHHVLAENIESFLTKRNKPDLVYAAVPSLAVAEITAKYCQKNNVRFVIDIQDLWPEAFKMILNIPIFSNLLFYPLKKQADRIYKAADEIVAVSHTYAKRGMKVNSKCKRAQVVYLGTDKEMFDKYASENLDCLKKPNNEIWIVYIGSLASSYDIKTVINAIKVIESEMAIRFIVIGSGFLKKEFETYAANSGIIYTFTGYLPYPKMVRILKECDIAVNPIRKGSAGSIINKVNDYAMAGLPVVNTQECVEYRSLLEKYNAGINCECENTDSVAAALQKLVVNSDLRDLMSINSRKLGEEQFARENSYQKLADEILRGFNII